MQWRNQLSGGLHYRNTNPLMICLVLGATHEETFL
jgi:hypothetical protein